MTKPQLKLFNALRREKQDFIPLDPEHIGMYVCGITPYDYAHIGNLRTMVVFDVLYRLLSHLYPEVTYVRNYTDIDDKIVERAQERGMEPFTLAAEFIDIFERDMAALNLAEPTEKPRVSEYMREIVAMVNGLLEKGFAYITASGDVMFDVPAFEKLGAPHDKFGHLARRTFDKLQARVEGDEEKRDPRDFPVWKANAKSATKLEQAFMPQQLGATYEGFTAPGRPGWHIECSVMAQQILNPNPQPNTTLFDIHGGGEDLAFPHHSCEIAQTEAFNPTCTMSSIWMHAAFLTVEGQKMSKSLNNFVLVSEALQKYSAGAIRLWLLQTHYRKPVDYSDEALEATSNRIRRWENQLQDVQADASGIDALLASLSDDLDTAKALAILEDLSPAQKRGALEFLGVTFTKTEQIATAEEQSLLDARITARKEKNWQESDRLRDALKALDIEVQDGPTGQTWRRL